MTYKYLLLILVAYLVGQAIFTSYYFFVAKNLSKITETGNNILGDKNNPKLSLYVAGDSVAAGVGATSLQESVGYKIAKELSKKYYVNYTNTAVSGFKVKDVLDQKAPTKKDIIVLIVSSNDLLHFTNIKMYEQQVQQMLEKYQKLGKQVIVLGPLRLDTATIIPLFLRPLYYFEGLKYLKVLELESAKFNNVRHTSPYYFKSKEPYGNIESKDRFHPNVDGHSWYANMIIKKLNKNTEKTK